MYRSLFPNCNASTSFRTETVLKSNPDSSKGVIDFFVRRWKSDKQKSGFALEWKRSVYKYK